RHVDLAERLECERREAVDLGRRDAGVVEGERDRLARERELRVGQALAELGLADPDDRGLVLDEGRGHQPFHSGVRRSRNAATPSPESTVDEFCSTSIASSSRRSRRDSSDASCNSFFAQPIALVGPFASRSAHSLVAACSSAAGTTLLTMPRRSASAAGRSSPKKISSLALCIPTMRGSRYATPPSGIGPRRPDTW